MTRCPRCPHGLLRFLAVLTDRSVIRYLLYPLQRTAGPLRLESRRAARTTPDGDPILLEDQDRSLWNSQQMAEGKQLVERATCMTDSTELCHQLNAKGQYLGASPLCPVALATSVRVRDGKRLITNGPFAETTEQLGSYYLIEVDHLDAAIAIAGALPAATKGTSEVRPIFALTNLPELTHGETT